MASCRYRSHPELGQEMPRRKKSDHTDKNEDEAERGGLPIAVAKEAEKGVGDEDEPCDRRQQNQREKVIGIAVCHGARMEQRGGYQRAAYGATGECTTADSRAHALNAPAAFP